MYQYFIRATGLALMVTVLVSCGDNRPLNQLGYQERLALVDEMKARCIALGIVATDPRHEECVLVELRAEGTRRDSARAGMAAMGSGISKTSQGYTNAANANRPVTCTTRPAVGWGTSTTTCQ